MNRKLPKSISLVFIMWCILICDSFAQEKGSVQELLNSGHQFSQEQNFEKAIESYKRALAKNPDFKPAQLSLKVALNKKELIDYAKTLPKKCQSHTNNFEQNFQCVRDHFCIGGQPINPRIIEDLLPLPSDIGNQVLSISLLGSQDSNRYFCENLKIDPKGPTISNMKKDDFFSYTVIGKTDSGLFVILTSSRGEGTAVFYDLLLVRIRKGLSLGNIEKQKLSLDKKMIVIEKLGSYPLGDRSNPKVSIQGNTVMVKTGNYLPPYEEKELKFTVNVDTP